MLTPDACAWFYEQELRPLTEAMFRRNLQIRKGTQTSELGG